MLNISNLTLNYDGIPALHDISMHVGEDEIVALLGSNGAGKSSTLRSISGLVHYGGKITYYNRDLSTVAPHKRITLGIAHVPEGRGVVGDLTVDENLRLATWGMSDYQYDDAFRLFPRLQERQKQLAGTLSGGEQQMLAIARAMLQKPKLLLLDEPSMGLSPKLMMEVFEALKQAHAKGVAILLVEQNARLALNFATRAYILENGRVALAGEAATLKNDTKIKELYLAG